MPVSQRSKTPKVLLPRSTGTKSPERYPAMVISPRDHSYFWQKEWHALDDLPRHIRRQFSLLHDIPTVSSPKARQEANRWYEGVVVLQGLANPSQRSQVVHMVRNINERARRRDEQDEVLRIEEQGDTVIIKTSENQLAASIARQVERAFKAPHLPRGNAADFRFSRDDDALRIYWSAPEKSAGSVSDRKQTHQYLRKGPKQKRR